MPEEKYIFKRDREMMLTPEYWNQLSHISSVAEKLYGVLLTREYVLYDRGRLRTIFLKKDWDKAENFIAPKLFNEKYFLNIKKEIARKSSAIAIFIKKIKKQNFKKFSFYDLAAAAEAVIPSGRSIARN